MENGLRNMQIKEGNPIEKISTILKDKNNFRRNTNINGL